MRFDTADADPDASSHADSGDNPHSHANAYPNASPNRYSHADSDANHHSHTNSYSNTHANTHSRANTHSHTNAHSRANTGTDVSTNASANTRTYDCHNSRPGDRCNSQSHRLNARLRGGRVDCLPRRWSGIKYRQCYRPTASRPRPRAQRPGRHLLR